MLVPAKSNKTLPGYFDHIIQGYTYKTNTIDYSFNNRDNPQHMNEFDYKSIVSFETFQPEKYIIMHASDVYLQPDDLRVMIGGLNLDDKAFCIGIYPINKNWKHCSHKEPVMYCTRIVVWKAEIFRECLNKFNLNKQEGDIGDETTRMAEYANEMGYHALVSKIARPFSLIPDEFATMRLG